jgi:hypothetical protein
MRTQAVRVVLLVLLLAATARGDGGTLRTSQAKDGYRISVFTAPTPPRVGTVDCSVLVQDAVTGKLLPEMPVLVTAWPLEAPHRRMSAPATTGAATNKLFRAALLELAEPGTWHVQVEAQGPAGPVRVTFEMEAGTAPPRWLELAGWIGWPFAAVLLFAVYRVRKGARPPRAGRSP